MRYIYTLLLVGLAFNVSLSQNTNEVDSIQSLITQENDLQKKNLLVLELAYAYINTDRIKTDSLAAMLISYAEKADEIDLWLESLSLRAYANYKDQKDDKALIYYKALDSLMQERGLKNKWLVKSKLYQSQIAKFSATEEGFQRCKEYLDEMLSVAVDINSEHYEHLAHLNLGDWHVANFGVNKKNESLALAEGNYQNALKYFKQEGDEGLASKSLWSLSKLELQRGNIDKSESYLRRRLEVLRNSKAAIELGNAYSKLGSFNIKYGKNYSRAISYYDSAMAIYNEKGFHNAGFKLSILNGYKSAHMAMANYKEALVYSEKIFSLRDSLEKNRNASAALEIETKYQTDKKNKEIELLTSENQLAAQKSRSQQIFFIGLISVMTITTIFLFLLFRSRQKTAAKLKELDRIKSNFFANISHEFRTPLTLIKSPVELALKDDQLPSELTGKLNSIDRNADRLLELVDQLLDLSQLESGTMQLQVEEDSLSSFLIGTLSAYEYKSIQDNLTFEQNYNITEQVWFDKDIVSKIVLNLVANAFKYTTTNGQITTDATLQNSQVIIEVSNTDNGLSEKNFDKVFERFYQVDDTSKGVGIGLALVKEFASLHHGYVKGRNRDGVTTFIVQIPANKTAYRPNEFKEQTVRQEEQVKTLIEAPQTGEIEDPNILSDNPIMLIVEDNTEVRGVIGDLFKNDYTILEAADGEEGIIKAMTYVPDIIISDVMMPKKDGVALAQIVKTDEKTSHIPLILLTGKAGKEPVIEGLETGADDYIVKPFNNDILRVRVKNLVELRAQLRQRYSQEVVLRPKDIAVSSADEIFLEKLQSLLDEHLTDTSFNAEFFSREVGMSRMQLHRKLKALVGLSTTEFIRSQRLKLAAHLLESAEINMSEVGYSVGFNDPSYFSKCFKEAYDCTPKQYATVNKPQE